jgi:hypothetical protein
MMTLRDDLSADLVLRDRKDGSLSGRAGLGLTLYYEQDMPDLVEMFRQATEAFLDFVPPDTINFYNNNGAWRPFSRRSVGRLLSRFASKTERGHWLTFAQIEAADDGDGQGPYATAEIGMYALSLFGRNRSKSGSFRDSCVSAIHCDLPHDQLQASGVLAYLRFVEKLAALTPFDSGHAGFTFIYSAYSDKNDEYEWISHKAPRYLAMHPRKQDWEYYARGRVVNVNWLTLLGDTLTAKLGGGNAMRERLSAAIDVHPLKYGTVLVAGETPPLGEVNRQAPDIGPLREVAALTRPYWIDEQTMINDVLNSFWHGDEAAVHWVRRFDPRQS